MNEDNKRVDIIVSTHTLRGVRILYQLDFRFGRRGKSSSNRIYDEIY